MRNVQKYRGPVTFATGPLYHLLGGLPLSESADKADSFSGDHVRVLVTDDEQDSEKVRKADQYCVGVYALRNVLVSECIELSQYFHFLTNRLGIHVRSHLDIEFELRDRSVKLCLYRFFSPEQRGLLSLDSL